MFTRIWNSRIFIVSALVCAIAMAVTGEAQPQSPRGPATGPTWGSIAPFPKASNSVFATADGCALCHSVGEKATALRTSIGSDGSPHGLWRATMMANSFRDPYWRAQVSREIAAFPERAEEIQTLCLTCHGPMASHTARLFHSPSPSIATAAADPLAVDGVSCTVCHQAQATTLGTPASFTGKLDIRPGRQIFGPYPSPMFGPMVRQSAFKAIHGPHIQESMLCGSCHTVVTSDGNGSADFHEQTPFLEWRNSEFSNEAGVTDKSRTCQQCHMTDIGTTRIARNVDGRDFGSLPRPNVRAHAFVGGNAFMLDMLRTNAAELGVTAPAEALECMAALTRMQLSDQTANLRIRNFRREGDALLFDVRVENKVGHKFPSAYPSRRAWLHVHLVDNQSNRVLYCSGAADEKGALRLVADERTLPHFDLIDDTTKVQVYEVRNLDSEGKPTTLLTAMAERQKDNRLLPRGWKADGPHADETGPRGTEGDANFLAGEDTVTYKVPFSGGSTARLTAIAWLNYQTIPPAWVAPLRTLDTDEARRFVRMYDSMEHVPETIAFASASASAFLSGVSAATSRPTTQPGEK